MTAALALVLALMVAVAGATLRPVLGASKLDAVVLTAVLAELAKKLAYIGAGEPQKALSLILAAPLLLAAWWWMSAPATARRRAWQAAPLPWLLVWFATLAFFTFRNPEGSPLILANYLVFLLWLPAAAGIFGEAGRWTYRVLWLAVIVAAANQLWGPDPLWRAYRVVAEPVSIGARYTPDTGYTGSLFSSPAELGSFVLAAAAFLEARVRRNWILAFLTLTGAVLTGSRYVMLALALFWLAFAWSGLARLRPWQAVVAVLAYSPVQDAVASRLLETQPTLATSSDPFLRRLFTVGTLSARAGFTEAWSSVFSTTGLPGSGSSTSRAPRPSTPTTATTSSCGSSCAADSWLW